MTEETNVIVLPPKDNKNEQSKYQSPNLTIDGVTLMCLLVMIGYNIGDVRLIIGNFRTYPFKLTHITALFMFSIVLASMIIEYRRKNNQSLNHFSEKHFSNAIFFAFSLSLLVDGMYWFMIYPSSPINTSTLNGRIDLADVILMHGIITICFGLWILLKKYRNNKAEAANDDNELKFKKPTFYQTWSWADVGLLFLPILLITVLYMGWTALGQAVTGEAIYTDMIDWSKSHIKSTFEIFGIAAAGLIVLWLIGMAIKKGFECQWNYGKVDSENVRTLATNQRMSLKAAMD